jgi:hypothetical protein
MITNSFQEFYYRRFQNVIRVVINKFSISGCRQIFTLLQRNRMDLTVMSIRQNTQKEFIVYFDSTFSQNVHVTEDGGCAIDFF